MNRWLAVAVLLVCSTASVSAQNIQPSQVPSWIPSTLPGAGMASAVMSTDSTGKLQVSTTLPANLIVPFTSSAVTTQLQASGNNSWGVGIIAPTNGTNYLDNVVAIQNQTINGSGQCGNSAIKFMDHGGHEHGAVGISNDASSSSGCTGAAWAPNTGYTELSNPDGDQVYNYDMRSTDLFAPSTSFTWMHYAGATNITTYNDHTGASKLTIDPETPLFSVAINTSITGSLAVNGSANLMTLVGSTSGNPVSITASGTDSSIQPILADKGPGTGQAPGVALNSNGKHALIAANALFANTNWARINGSATGSAIVYTADGTVDTSVDVQLLPKGAGNVDLLISGASGLIHILNSASFVAASNCGSLLTSTGCLAVKDNNGNTVYAPLYGTL